MTTPAPRHGADRLEVLPVGGMPEVRAGDDLAELLVRALSAPLRPGDVVVVTSKVVAKAAGLVVGGERDAVVEQHTDRVVAIRGPLRVVRLRTGLTLAAAGVDESNTEPGTVVPLPPDPDSCAAELRRRLLELTGTDVAVLVTDTGGRAWREGQTDLAIGVAGLPPLLDLAGTLDAAGVPLRVTAPAIADEVAAAADLVQGKALGRPFAVVRGLAHLMLDRDDAGPGGRALVRDEANDLFGLGSQDAVRHAVRRDDRTAVRGFPAPGPVRQWLPSVVQDALAGVDPALARAVLAPGDPAQVVVLVPSSDGSADVLLAAGALTERVRVLAAAHRAGIESGPYADAVLPVGWRAVACLRVVVGSDSADHPSVR